MHIWLHEAFRLVVCSACGKHCRFSEAITQSNPTHPTLCMNCAPRQLPLQCTVCKENKHPEAFEHRYRSAQAEKLGIRRCKACGERCTECNTYLPDDRKFATNSSKCWRCYSKEKKGSYACAKCKETKPRGDFNDGILQRHLAEKALLVCRACQDLGYSPDKEHGLDSYQCVGGHERGHILFPSQLVYDVRRGHTSAAKLVCLECKQRPQVKCSVPSCAKGNMPEWEFEQSMLRSARKICRACSQLGFTLRRGGTESLRCDACRRNLGPTKFAQSVRADAKRNKGVARCIDCFGW